MPDDLLQAAVDRANRAIQAHFAALPHPDYWTPDQHARYDRLLAAWRDAVRAQEDAARAREGDDEAEPVAA